MQNTDFLKLNVPGLSDPADIRKISEDMTWIDEAIKKFNELMADVELRLSRLELKADSTSELRRDVDSLISRVNSLAEGQTANANRINAISDRVTANETNITAIKTSIGNISASIKSITDSISSLDARVTALEGSTPTPTPEPDKFYVYYGPSSAAVPTSSVVSNLAYKVYTSDVTRTISVACNNEYAYYAVPADQPAVKFVVSNFEGGFENPVQVGVIDAEGGTTMYKVYRSTQLLTGTAPIVVKKA